MILSTICVYIAACHLNVSAHSSESFYYFDDYNYLVYNVSDGKATITSCMCGGDIAIPEEIEGYPVATIGYRAFHLSEMITSVSLPDNLITIEDEAFAGCKLLQSLVVPQNVQSIGNCAIGYDFVATTVSVGEKYSDFTLIGFENTITETYANENGFTFIALDEPISTTTAQTTQTTSTSTTTTTTISSDNSESTNISTTVTTTLSTTAITSDNKKTTTQTSAQSSTASTVSNQTITTTQKINSVSNGNANNSKGSSTSSPKTGDSFPIVSVLTAIGISAVSTVLFMKKRK